MTARKICVVTGTRADYGLLYWLMKEIEADKELELLVIATGMHLSAEFGMTFKQIEDDGFSITYKLEMLLSSDTESAITKSMGLGLIGFADAYDTVAPDLIVLLGDRFETFVAATAATVARIPVVHIHGGEATEGAFDEGFRHSITKMSHLHFTAAKEYRNRVIQLGEDPERVFNVGAAGIDNIKRLKLLSREELEKSIGLNLAERNLLITFHPTTLEDATAEEQFKNLLRALNKLDKTHFIFTKANADTNGRIINQMIDRYVELNPDKAVAHTSLGQRRYLSAMKLMNGVVGNSSSGLLEAPSMKVGTINIGDRQRGRIQAESVINCMPCVEEIGSALDILFSHEFSSKLQNVISPYGNGKVAEKIVKVLRTYPLKEIIKKKFYDLECSK